MRFLKLLMILSLAGALLSGCATPETPVLSVQTQEPVEKPQEEETKPIEKPTEPSKEDKPIQKPADKPEEELKVEKPKEEPKPPAEVTVPILMFHDIKSYAGGPWSMSAENFEKTLVFLLEEGYTPIFFDELADYAAGVRDLPEKPICITLDDGYYSNYKYVLPIVTRLEIPITVFVICGMVRETGTEPDADEEALSKMSAYELAIMEGSPYVQIQSHTYALHGPNRSYGEAERNSVLPLASEDKEAYQQIFSEDCALAEKVLNGTGVFKHTVFSYPNGKTHAWSEEVLRGRGYRATITTDYNRINTVKMGDPASAYLLGRMNVNDATTQEELLKYLERKGM